jgi:hypothetical protein
MWSAVRELLDCSWNLTCFADLYKLLDDLSGKTKRMFWIGCTALCWATWNIRNKFTIEGSFPSQPADGLYKMLIYLQAWKPMARRRDWEALEHAIGRLRTLHASIRDRVD